MGMRQATAAFNIQEQTQNKRSFSRLNAASHPPQTNRVSTSYAHLEFLLRQRQVLLYERCHHRPQAVCVPEHGKACLHILAHRTDGLCLRGSASTMRKHPHCTSQPFARDSLAVNTDVVGLTFKFALFATCLHIIGCA